MSTVKPNVQDAIKQAFNLNHRIQHLFAGRDEERVLQTERHFLSMVYWSLIVEHHQAILHLIDSNCHASAFALLRPFEEAFLRSFVAVFGTIAQGVALWNDKYNTEFEAVGKQIDKKLSPNSQYGPYGPFFKDRIKTLHSFTHGGMKQLVKFVSLEPDQIAAIGGPKVSKDEVLNIVMTAMLVLFEAALFLTDFWGDTSEHQSIHMMHIEYCEEAANACGIDINTLEIYPRRTENGSIS